MSLLPAGISLLRAVGLGLLSPVLFNQRSIGGFVADVTVEERHLDELTITEHPVEQGAAITDHAFKRPAVVMIRAGWSNSSLQALGDPTYATRVYQQFLDLQGSRQPFDVVTGKRLYTNMLIQRLGVTTDEKTENVLMMTVECREIIIVSTQTVSVPSADQMKTPQLNAATQTDGVKQLAPAPNYNAAAAAQ